MTPEEAESILAFQAEVNTALQLAADEASFRRDWRVQFAVERVLERVFQAGQNLPPARRDFYFGDDGFKALRGMRNRLAHNYLAVDDDILWESLSVDIPLVRDRLQSDAEAANILISELMSTQDTDSESWRRNHLARIDPESVQSADPANP